MNRPPLQAVTVVVPARDEQEALPGCLDALDAAVRHLHATHPHVVARVVVVLDSCTDASAAVVRAHQGTGCPATVLEVSLGNVGAVREAGAAAVLAAGDADPAAHWLACTDADTHVPADWLTVQVAAADDGADVLVGTVEPDEHLPDEIRRAWAARHRLTEGHAHVHGANLGVRASHHLAVGGFAALRVHEDVDLVHRLRQAPGTRVEASDEHRVTTSSRTDGRAEDGFATYLRDLAEEVGR